MSKPFFLEMDDRTDEERAKDKANKKAKGIRGPMDTDFPEDEGVIPCKVRIKTSALMELQGIKEDPAQIEKERFDRERLFDAVSSGDVSKLEGLHDYLRKQNKRLTDSTYQPDGKTALMKALLNLKNGKNEAVEHLLDIAEKMGHLEEFVKASYTEGCYEGQTALHIAIEKRSKHFAELLIQKGADVHAKACGSFFQPHGGACFYFGELPLSLAACTNQKDIVDLLMDNSYHKADVRRRDSQGNTVLHALVMMADNSPENTDFVISMYDYILTKDVHLNPVPKNLEDIKNNKGLIPLKLAAKTGKIGCFLGGSQICICCPEVHEDDHKNLEDIENKKRLTPLKLAAQTGKIGLFEHILNREFQQEECRHLSRKFTEWAYGPVYASLFDLGSIDTFDEENSVLEIIVYGSAIPNRLEMLQTEPLNKLLEDKWDRFARWIFLFKFICYLIYLIIFTVLCCHHNVPNPEEVFRPKSHEDWLFLAGQVFTCAASIYFFLKGLMDMKRKPPRLQTLLTDGYSDLIFFLQAMCFLVYMGLYYNYRDNYLSFLVVCLALSWINLLYFSRGSQHMGIYSVMIQRIILGDMLRFLVVYLVFLFGFSAAVMTLLQDRGTNTTEDNVTEDSVIHGRTFFEQISDQPEGCKKLTYKNMSFTTLELFKFTIGMGDLEFTEQYQDKAVFYTLLISYIVLTYILLLNMLIALMSRTVEVLSKESTKIWKLQRAITILDLERSLGQCLKKKLRSGVKKDLDKKNKDKDGASDGIRWCLRVEEVNWNKCNQNLGIISEDPGNFSRAIPPPSTPQRGQSLNKYLRGLSRWRPNTDDPKEEQETTPLKGITCLP